MICTVLAFACILHLCHSRKQVLQVLFGIYHKEGVITSAPHEANPACVMGSPAMLQAQAGSTGAVGPVPAQAGRAELARVPQLHGVRHGGQDGGGWEPDRQARVWGGGGRGG